MKSLVKMGLGLTGVLTLGLVTAGEPVPHGVPYVPIGKLGVDQEMVRSGINPLVDWSIKLPVSVTDIVDITPTSRLTVKESSTMEVRVVGVAFQSGATHLPCAVWVNHNSSSWVACFGGKYTEVDPENPVMSMEVGANTTVDLAARGQNPAGGWYSPRWTLDSSPTCMALKNGDEFPDIAPAYGQGRIESFLSGYVDGDNRAVLGPRDLIFIFECYSTVPGSDYFDLQDVVVLVTFKPSGG